LGRPTGNRGTDSGINARATECRVSCLNPAYGSSKYQSLVIRREHKKAIIAIAHKIIRTIFFVLTRRQPYRDSGFDYQAASVAKNAPRWIKALKQFGFWPEVIANA
jgi:hypothetical protein